MQHSPYEACLGEEKKSVNMVVECQVVSYGNLIALNILGGIFDTYLMQLFNFGTLEVKEYTYYVL